MIHPRMGAEEIGPSVADIICPIGLVEPAHVGQFFFDAVNEVYYRACGPDADSWCLVTPAEFLGSHIKSFVDFLEPMHHAVKLTDEQRKSALVKHAMRMERAPHHVDADGAAQAGFRVDDARLWTTASDVRVMQARVLVEGKDRRAVFVGFAAGAPSAVMMPAIAGMVYDRRAVGVLFEDDHWYSVLGGEFVTSVGMARWERSWVRVEMAATGDAVILVDGCELARGPFVGVEYGSLIPRVSQFRYEAFR